MFEVFKILTLQLKKREVTKMLNVEAWVPTLENLLELALTTETEEDAMIIDFYTKRFKNPEVRIKEYERLSIEAQNTLG